MKIMTMMTKLIKQLHNTVDGNPAPVSMQPKFQSGFFNPLA